MSQPTIVKNKLLWNSNRTMGVDDATGMDQINGSLCRIELNLDLHFTPGHPVIWPLVVALNQITAAIELQGIGTPEAQDALARLVADPTADVLKA